MSQTVKLREIASARAGDKGNTSNIAVWVYDHRHYQAVKAALTAERVKATFPNLFKGLVTRYAVDKLGGLNFVIEDGLEGGVNESLNLDSHGKSFSFLILDIDIPIPDELEPKPSAANKAKQATPVKEP